MEADAGSTGTVLDRRGVIVAELEGGQRVQVEVRRSVDAEEDVAVLDVIPFDSLSKALEGIAKTITTALATASPKRAAVELGLDIGVESGALTAMLVKGTGSATLKVTLEWESAGSPSGGND